MHACAVRLDPLTHVPLWQTVAVRRPVAKLYPGAPMMLGRYTRFEHLLPMK